MMSPCGTPRLGLKGDDSPKGVSIVTILFERIVLISLIVAGVVPILLRPCIIAL